MDWSLAIVIATVMGPILAVQAQKYLERHQDRKRAKDAIFRVLMATRANRLAPDHVQALNEIELAFYAGREKEKKVRESWIAYHNHLNDKSYVGRAVEWETRQIDLLIELLHEMAVCLGYDFDRTHVRTSWYSPTAHGTIEQQSNEIRGALAEILTGKRSLPVVGYAASEEDAREMAELRRGVINWLKANPRISSGTSVDPPGARTEPDRSSQAQAPRIGD